MLTVWTSNRIEQLLVPLGENITRSTPGYPESLFHTVDLLVPNPSVESFVRYLLAERLGILANVQFHYLEGFLSDRLLLQNPPRTLLSKTVLERFVWQALLDEMPHHPPIQQYIESDDDVPSRERRRVELAHELARQFDTYFLSRPDLLERWREGRLSNTTAEVQLRETWQRAVWRRIFAEGGLLEQAEARSEELAASPLERSQPLRWTKPGWPDRGTDLDHLSLPKELHVFGFTYVAYAYQRLFGKWGERANVHVYTLYPCLEFEEDFRSLGLRPPADRHLFTVRELAESEPSLFDDPYDLDDIREMPIVRQWARPAREKLYLWVNQSRAEVKPRFADPLAEATKVSKDSKGTKQATLLEMLQREILLRKDEEANSRPAVSEDDRSIEFFASPNIAREVEGVANEIWRLLHADPQPAGERLRFHQIGVVVADRSQLANYQTQLQTTLAQTYRLPHTILDLEGSRQSRYVDAVRQLIEFPLRPVSRASVLEILTHPALLEPYPEVDPVQWGTWCEQVGITFGSDRHDHAETYIDENVFHWDQGLTRLALGCLMEQGHEEGFEVEVEAGTFLPSPLAAAELPTAALLIGRARLLLEQARLLREAKWTFAEWGEGLRRYLKLFLQPSDEDDEAVFASCLRCVAKLRQAALDRPAPRRGPIDPADPEIALEPERVSYWTASQFALEELSGLSGSLGRYLTEGIAVASMVPMRAVPFRVLFVLGLGEGCFPTSSPPSELDLTQFAHQAGDVSPRDNEIYLFLETILSARQRLVLSYVSRDAQTGEPRAASSLVQQLQNLLTARFLDRKQLKDRLREFPLRPYDAQNNFVLAESRSKGKDGKLLPLSLDPEAEREFYARQLRGTLQAHLHQPSTPAIAGAEQLNDLAPSALRHVYPRSLHSWLRLVDLPAAAVDPAKSPNEGPRRLPTRSIQDFLEQPLRAWAENVLGIDAREEDDPLLVEEETFEANRLIQTILLRNLFAEMLQRAHERQSALDVRDVMATYGTLAYHGRRHSSMPVGVFAEWDQHRHEQVLKSWSEAFAEAGLSPLWDWKSYRWGPPRASDTPNAGQARLETCPLPPLELVHESEGNDGPAAESFVLEGETLLTAIDAETQTAHCLVLVPRDQKSTDLSRSVVTRMGLAAAGLWDGLSVKVHLLGHNREKQSSFSTHLFSPLTAAAGRDYLVAMVADLMGQPHSYTLTWDMMQTFAASGGTASPLRCCENAKAEESSSAGVYFRLVNPQDRPFPSEDEFRALFAARYELHLTPGPEECALLMKGATPAAILNQPESTDDRELLRLAESMIPPARKNKAALVAAAVTLRRRLGIRSLAEPLDTLSRGVEGPS